MNHNPHNGSSASARKQKFARPVKPEEMNRMPGTEDRGRRTRSSKIFSLGRGLYQAVMYPDVVHFKNKATGELQEIDNRLVAVTDPAGDAVLTNRCNDELKVEFRNAQSAAMILMQTEDGRTLSWNLENAQNVQPQIINAVAPVHEENDRRRAILDKLEGEVVYENIIPGVDMNCSVQALRFKDFFTFKELSGAQPLTFLFSMPDMVPEKLENGSIQIIAPTGEVAFTLPKPFMKDASVEASYGAVDVLLEPAGDPFTWRVTYTPDVAWMQTAQFPVILDPAVITKNHSTSIEDNFVTSKKASTVQSYSDTGMTVSYNSSSWGISRAFIKYLPSGLPSIDSSYYISKAMFSVKTKTDPTTSASMYYTYDANGLLTSATNCDGVKVIYEYYTAREPFRVKRVRITGGDLCAYDRTYEYKDCLTVVTDNLSGKQLFYHFNDNGNCVSVNDQLGYACFAQYSDEYPVNHPETISKMQRSVVNFLAGHNMEASGSWTNANISGTGTYSYATDAYYMGAKSLKMAKTNTSGLMTSYQTVSLTKGKTYTFSSYFKTLNSAAAQLRVVYKDSAGSDVTVDSETKTNTSAWDRISVSFTLPSDSTSSSVTVRLMAANGTGSVWFDCVQLEEGPVANRYNMLINGDFTLNSGAHPTGWSKNSSNDSGDIVYTTCTGTKPEGLSANTMRMYGTGRTKYAGIYQDIKISGSEGDVFVAGGWSLNFSKPRKGEDFRYNIRVAFLKSGTSSTRVNTTSIEWSEEWTDWQFAAGPVVAPCNYTAIRFNVDYERNINYAEFNGLFLHKEEFGQTYVYDSKGNVLSAKNAASLEDGATYDDFDNILTYYQPGRSSSVKTTMEWGSTDAEKKKHLLRKSTSPLGIVKEFTYDSNGNQLTAKTTDGTNFMQTSTAYTSNGNHVATQTDARGKTVSRVTNTAKDTLTSVTDPRGQTVNYTYDQNRKVTKTAAIVDGKEYANSYTYTKDKLTQVKHNTSADASGDVAYNFEYDALGRPTVVKVGNQVLSTTTYNEDGTVQRVDYGNEDSVEYTYDEFKRTKGVRYGFDYEERYVYEYGANGQVAQLTNTDILTVTTSEHDAAGRPARITRKHLDTGAHLYTGEVSYDEFNNLKTFKEQVGSDHAAYTTTFTHDNENRPTQLNFGSSRQVAYVYDGLGRISRRTVNAGGTGVATTYGYLAGGHSTGSTTPLVQTITQSGTTLTYAYDDAGNITSVSDGSKTISYEYDLLGQLTRVNDPYDTTAGTSGTTWKYVYDQGGNIQSKTAYAFTTGNVGTVVKTDSFAYGDANWKDKLTAFNGTTINYDEIGNPTNDGTWNYTWIGGRQMRAMYKGEFGEQGYDEITFEYNENGLRTKKTRMYYDDATGAIGYKATNYTLHGKNIVHLSDGSNELHFFYDAQNRPCVVLFNGTAYAYQYNLQGDVIGLLDSSGTKMVSYTYDAWGKMLSKTGTLAGTLGTIQPFRYRGYVFDEETGLYYLRSRFYNATHGRFLNADANIGHSQGIISHNIMAYCCNRPINYFDPDGKWLLFASMCALLGGIFYVDHKIANMSGLTEAEKLVARAHPIEAAIAKNASDVAGELTNKYWGANATNYDATTANAFKHAVWNALMTRDLGSSMAYDFATAHEYPYYGDMSPYQMWYDASIVITIHDGTVMDLINNERGRMVGQSVPFYYSNDQVAQAVIADMLANPEAYCVLVDNYCTTPIQ